MVLRKKMLEMMRGLPLISKLFKSRDINASLSRPLKMDGVSTIVRMMQTESSEGIYDL